MEIKQIFRCQFGIRIFLFVLGFACLAAGLVQGGYRDTMLKAIMICLECIGIG